MASRWTMREDYIVCKYAYERPWKVLTDEQYNELMSELQQQGFCARSKVAVDKRVRDYQLLFHGWPSPYATRQVLAVCQTVMNQVDNPDVYKRIKSYIRETFNANEPSSANAFFAGENDNTMHYVHTIDFCSTFPMVLQKFIDQKGFKKHKEIYDRISMKQDTFSAILRGKYPVVKKENVLRLCVGLNLSVDEAEELMESAGYLFSRGIMTDVVVKAYLKHQCYDTFAIDNELCENNAPVLFAIA